MTTETENPYVASVVESEQAIETGVPLNTYGYAFVAFVIAWFGGSFVLVVPLAFTGLDELLVFATSMLLGIPCGLWAGSRMYRKLADIHRRKVALEVAQAERLGEFY